MTKACIMKGNSMVIEHQRAEVSYRFEIVLVIMNSSVQVSIYVLYVFAGSMKQKGKWLTLAHAAENICFKAELH